MADSERESDPNPVTGKAPFNVTVQGGIEAKGTIKQNGTAVSLSGHTHTAAQVGAATMAQVNAAINTAITGAMGASY